MGWRRKVTLKKGAGGVGGDGQPGVRGASTGVHFAACPCGAGSRPDLRHSKSDIDVGTEVTSHVGLTVVSHGCKWLFGPDLWEQDFCLP